MGSRLVIVLGLLAMAIGVVAAPARAEDAQQACEVPSDLVSAGSTLPKVAEVIRAGRTLSILVVGSRSSTIPGSEGSGYPAILEASLKNNLPQLAVNVSVEILSKKTAEEVAGGLAKLLEGKTPTLVIWQTGTVDAMRSIDPDEFRSSVEEGVLALQNAGADVLLMNLQYSPRTETMIAVGPYLDNIRAVAQEHEVPLFDRFGIMRQWNESGDFDLFSTAHGPDLAKRVHDCLGRALSKFIIDAAHIGPTQEN